MAGSDDLVSSRAPYFAPVDLATSDIFCGDERTPLDAAEPFIHVFGGALFVPYTLCILQTCQGQTPDFMQMITDVVSALAASGVAGQGVHSDEASEQDQRLQTERVSGGVGCGFACKRAVISQLIADQAEDIIAEIERLQPDVIAHDDDRTLARELAQAHGRLAAESSIQDGGRAAVLTAVQAGAKTMLVSGQHSATAGIINTQAGSTLQTGAALTAGLPTYDHDLWVSQALFDRLPARLQAEPHEAAIASLLDIVGTLWALGAHSIAVR